MIHPRPIRAPRGTQLTCKNWQIEAAYRLALGRLPTRTERAEAVEFLAAYRSELVTAKKENVETAALAALARVLFGSNEFLAVD